MTTTRERLEKATADWLKHIDEVSGKDGGPSAEDQEKMSRFETEVNGLLAALKSSDAAAQAKTFVDNLAGRDVASAATEPQTKDGIVVPTPGMTLGEAFVKSPAYKDFLGRYAGADGLIKESTKGVQSSPFTSQLGFKDIVTGTSATSAGAAIRDDFYAPITDLIGERELTVADLVTRGTTTSDTVQYVRVTGKTNNASPVVEASATGGTSGQKPESALALEVVSAVVKTIAHWMPITKRAASDAAQVRTLVESFLRYGLGEELEDQILNGDGTGENFTGILQTSGISSVGSAGTDLDAIVDAIRTIRADRRRPTAVVFHPNDWFSTGFLLAKDTAGNYLVGDPRASIDQLNQLWGLRVVVTEAMTENTALVGDYRQAVLWEREGITLSMTDSHSDYFTRNLLAILAEGRWAFGVLDPDGFCKVTAI